MITETERGINNSPPQPCGNYQPGALDGLYCVCGWREDLCGEVTARKEAPAQSEGEQG